MTLTVGMCDLTRSFVTSNVVRDSLLSVAAAKFTLHGPRQVLNDISNNVP